MGLINLEVNKEFYVDFSIYKKRKYNMYTFYFTNLLVLTFSCLENIPFPYVKEKMPPLPKNATDAEKKRIQNL